MVMQHGGGTECGRGVFRAKRKRVSAKPIERHEEVAEERVRGAEPKARVMHSAINTALLQNLGEKDIDMY